MAPWSDDVQELEKARALLAEAIRVHGAGSREVFRLSVLCDELSLRLMAGGHGRSPVLPPPPNLERINERRSR